MNPDRLSPLDASFLTAETPAAHMHVGWAAAFAVAGPAARPTFGELRDHIAARLHRAPRYRQRLAPVPLGVHDPAWVDDQDFEIGDHVLRATSCNLSQMANEVMSRPLARDRPLWTISICERLEDGRVGLVGKVHHCMVDGLAAVDLAMLLLDATADPEDPGEDRWAPRSPAGDLGLLARGLRDRAADVVDVATLPARIAASPSLVGRALAGAGGAVRALTRVLADPAQPSLLNQPLSPSRHLATRSRPLADLKAVRSRAGTTVNDVVLASVAGGLRRYLRGLGEPVQPLRAMVPVSMRAAADAGTLGNDISFVFIGLPCEEPDSLARLRLVQSAMDEAKRSNEPAGAHAAMQIAGLTPRPVRNAITRIVASARVFNLVVSNIPGPTAPVFMLGCALEEAYPVVPLAEDHLVSIGLTTVGEIACLGVYADGESLPDVDDLAACIDAEFEELLRATDSERAGAEVG